ncbi:hypothetical protein F5J12DRAFT_784519 [Pisolithus orientalis]|uniref:uncharacterized protein n=1 Tax=Pisolithus orientalis TaxID=936130 RepID=UPI0022255681|nr:uncharacterized protein F5J12DRAFT_784519 [Pisolithus orientalis]KAI6000217.1 hypothetical protein F5J12DRAFT_784519 [Pisolithus orientalis]
MLFVIQDFCLKKGDLTHFEPLNVLWPTSPWYILVVNIQEHPHWGELRPEPVCASQWCNSFAPAACLPGDVLLLIFELGLENRDTYMLRSLSQALNLVNSAMWVTKILRCSQAVPLDIHFNTAEDNTGYAIPNLTTILANYFERCANLHIKGYGDDIEEVLGTAIMATGTVYQLLSVLALLPGLEDLWLQDSFVNGETDQDTCVCTASGCTQTSITCEVGCVGVVICTNPTSAIEYPRPECISTRLWEGVGVVICNRMQLLMLASTSVTFKDWVCPLAIPDTHLTDLIGSIPTVVAVQRVEDFWVSLPVGIKECLTDPNTWSHFFC